jgi:hypothetical protein
MSRRAWATLGLCLLVTGRASADFSDWSYRRSVSLSVATGTSNYQVRIDLTTNNFNYANCNAAGNDLRFEDPNTLASLPYWIQTWTNAGTSTIWVAVANTGTTNLTLYYGKSGATTASDGTNTFVFFDTFSGSGVDTNRWTVDDATGWSVANGELKGANTTGRLRSKATFSSGVILEIKSRTVSKPTNGFQIGGFYVSTANGFGFLNHPGGDYYRNDSTWTAKGSEIAYAGVNMLTRIAVRSTTQVDFNVNDFNTGSSLWAAGTLNNGVSGESIALGFRFDGQNGGQAYEAYWDWVRVRKYAATEPVATVGSEQTNFLPGAPQIAHVGVYNILTNAADAVALLTTGDAPVTVTCYWGTNDGGNVSSAWMTNTAPGTVAAGTQVTNTITGLNAGAIYYFRYCATNNAGTNWATASTLFAALGPPSLDNGDGPYNVARTSATLRVRVLSGNPITNVWIYWGTNNAGTAKESWSRTPLAVTNAQLLVPFPVNVTGLLPSQTNWYAGYASNEFGEVWSSGTNFVTRSQPTNFNISADGDRTLNAGASLVSDEAAETIVPSLGPTITGHVNTYSSVQYIYDWNNIDGAGTDAADHLIMGNRKLTTTDGSSFTLRLENANGKGDVIGTLDTAQMEAPNAGGVCGSITLLRVRDVSMGGIRARPAAYNKTTGNITIGESTNRARNVRVAFLDTSGGSSYEDYTGDITVYGSGSVRIQTAGGVAGAITTYSRSTWSPGGDTEGEVLIDHDGDFLAGTIDTHAIGDDYSKGGRVTLSGGSGTGACVVGATIDASHPDYASGSYYGGTITVRNYASVTIGTLKTSGDGTTAGNQDIFVTNIVGNITVTNVLAGAANFRNLTMTCGGSATLGSLNLAICATARLDAVSGAFINGSLANFPVTTPTSGKLDCAGGRTIFYPYAGGTNAYLLGHNYPLKSGGTLVSLRMAADNDGGASNVSASAATLNGCYGGPVADAFARIYYGKSDGGTTTAWDAFVDVGPSVAPGFFSAAVGVDGNSTYYYRAYVSNAVAGAAWATNAAVFSTYAVTIQETDPSASEAGPDTGTLTISRPPTATNADLVVNLTVSGTAAEGVDYQPLARSVTLPRGVASVPVIVTPIDDPLTIESSKTVTLGLAAGLYLAGTPGTGTVTIANNPNSSWRYGMKIFFPGYNRPETLTNFPALVLLNESLPSFKYSRFASTNGWDLRFVNSNATVLLNYEVERWSTNGTSLVWVQLPTLAGSNDYIWACWGNRAMAGAPAAFTTNGATWSPNHAGVWHMAQTSAADSSTNLFSGTAVGTVTQVVGGAGGPADGVTAGSYVRVAANPAFTLTIPYTVSAWIRPASVASDQGFLGTYNSGSAGFIFALMTSANLQFWANGTWYNSTVPVGAGAWKQVVYTCSGTTGQFYIDGLPAGAATGAKSLAAGTELWLGAAHWNNNFAGGMDEVRLAPVSSSSNWVWACYMTMASNSTFTACQAVIDHRYGTMLLFR